MKLLLLVLALAGLAAAKVHFKETFEADPFDKWIAADGSGKWKHSAGPFYGNKELDAGLQTSQDAKFYAISAAMPEPVNTEGKTLVAQFQVRFPQKLDCGGGYIKLKILDTFNKLCKIISY